MLLECPFSKIVCEIFICHKHGSGEWGLPAIYGVEKILKNSSSVKPFVRFRNNFT